ncbi:MAG: stage II sporulation protein R [Oscillospiraceae bacterium]
MKRILTIASLLLGIVLSTAAGTFLAFSERCETVQGEVLRLHIPANSDSAEDQAIKLRVRDYILEEYGPRLSECSTLESAENRARELLTDIGASATEFLLRNGFDYGAKAELVTMHFTTREYERLILPAGEYRALRITLGSGEGQNWWCVIFPQLCLPACSEQTESAEQVLDSFGKPQKITVKFAVYEFFQRLANKNK